MKNSLSILFVILLSLNVLAQSKDDPKHENHFKQINPISTDVMDIVFSDAHAQQEFCLIKLNIKNKSKDFIILNTSEIVFKFEHGEFRPKPKEIIIAPNTSKKYTAKVNGNTQFHVESFTMELKGFSFVLTNVKSVETEKFQVPANKNVIDIGDFKVNLLKSTLETQESKLIFTCMYSGSKLGILDPSQLTITTEKGEWANEVRKSKPVLLKNGDKKKFSAVFHIPGKIVDMQFETMHIDWKDTFKESESITMDSHTLKFELDQGLTDGRNQ